MAIKAAGMAPFKIILKSFKARPVTIGFPYPPAPINAAKVAVPTLIMAEVLMPLKILLKNSS